jgi:hypothetical protein
VITVAAVSRPFETTAPVFNIPGGATGNHQVIVAVHRPSSATISLSGWNSSSTTHEGARVTVFTRALAVNVSAGTVTGSASAAITGEAYGLNATGPVVTQSGEQATFKTNAFGTSHTTPSATAADADSTWLQAVATCSWPRSFTPPSGVTEIADSQGTAPISWVLGLAIGEIGVGSGATGVSGAWTSDDPGDYADEEDSIGVSIIIGPESASTGRTDIHGSATLPRVQWVGFSRAASSVADGGTIAITATVVDQRGRGIPNAVVTVNQSIERFSATPTATNESGGATFNLTATSVGVADLHLSVGGVDSRTLAFSVT